MIRLIIISLLLSVLAGCVTINVTAPPQPTPPPPPCPELAFVSIDRTIAGEVVRLRATNPGPGVVIIDQQDFSLVDTEGGSHRAPSDTRTLRAGEGVPITLTAHPARGWINLARLDAPPCPPATVAVPDPR